MILAHLQSDPKSEQPDTLLVELLPGKRTIRYSHKTLFVYFPYTYFFIEHYHFRFGNLTLGFRNQPLDALNQEIILPDIPNRIGFSLCLGDATPMDTSSPQELADQTIDAFFSSSYSNPYTNLHVTSTRHREITPLMSLREWHNASKHAPLTFHSTQPPYTPHHFFRLPPTKPTTLQKLQSKLIGKPKIEYTLRRSK